MYKAISLFLLLAVVSGRAIGADLSQCSANIPDAAGYKILRTEVNVRWGAALKSALPVKQGDDYTQANVNAARESVRQALISQDGASLMYLDRVSARFIEPCTIVEDPSICQSSELHIDQCVLLRIDVYSLHIPAVDSASLVPDKSQSNTDTHLNGVPKPLLALRPAFGATRDSGLGIVEEFQTTTQLGLLSRTLNGNSVAQMPSDSQVLIETTAKRAANTRYYLGGADLTVGRVFNGILKELDLVASFGATSTPLGSVFVRRNEVAVSGAGIANTGTALFRSVLGEIGYDHLNGALIGSASNHDTEDSVEVRIASDGLLWRSPFRMAAWFRDTQNSAGLKYQTVVGRVGYQKNVAVSPHQTIGVEIIGGYGLKGSGYSTVDRFAGGSIGANFLYDSFRSLATTPLPSGPVIRSIGAGLLDWVDQGISARESFVHVNGTFTIPIGVSKPLIPAFEVLPGLPVSQMIKNQVDNNNLLKQTLISQGYSEDAAQKEQNRVMNAVKPAIHYIADQANLWSVKPLIAVDYARTQCSCVVSRTESWPAAGAGVQLEMVTAQFQIGYMHLLPSSATPRVGNLFFRLIFQNFF